ncbi:MAG TPA: acyl-CoA dehydrogenase family protein [Candidatus Binatia bacterium]|nr:acyl-CoA dehydrogenase family protein [Candidatus Binatia bacterium]
MTNVLQQATTIVDALQKVRDEALHYGRTVTEKGKGIDDHQVHAERLAYLATEVEAARALLTYAQAVQEQGDAETGEMALGFAAEVGHKLLGQADIHLADFGFTEAFLADTLGRADVKAAIRAGAHESRFCQIGRSVITSRGVNNSWLESEIALMTRDSVRQFARSEVSPVAEQVHRHDELIPERIIQQMAELGFFGMSVPEEYGGGGMGNLAMIITTEELSAASLGVAGSLITRPEILTKALLRGGSEAQKQKWLPPIAAGKLMVAISVTEPDTGSDVASVKCRAEAASVGGEQGFVINGAKAWCTFAGRANIIALLARTNPDPRSGARGLSLYIVEKDAFPGHSFEMRQPTGGVLQGNAIPTLGYRGMHSYVLSFDNYFVPTENLVGEEGGLNKGFYLQMAGFAAGRLQTGGRATGLAQAALEVSATYANERKQFGSSLGDFQLTQYKLGRMATHLAAARQLTYTAAPAMDKDEAAAVTAAMAKLLACDVAVWVTQEGQLIHGGWGYGEEYAISRYVVDALVLPIFEGVKPILELKVIARTLLA